MIRRLHEIEPPKLSLPSEKSNTSEDAAAKESLASEFKKLLEKARSGIVGARDEVSALGFALSQAISTVRQQEDEIKSASQAEDLELGLEEVVVCDKAQGDLDAVRQSDGKGTNAQVISGPSSDADTEGEEVSTDLEGLDDGAVVLDEEGETITLDDEIVFTEVEEFDLADEVTLEDQTLAAQIVAQQGKIAQNNQESSEVADVEAQLETESAFQRVSQNVTEEGEEEEILDEAVEEDLVAQVTDSQFSRPQLKGNSSSERSSDEYTTGDEDLDRFLAQYQTESRAETFEDAQDSQFRSPFGENKGGLDFDRAMSSQKRDGASFSPSAHVEGFLPPKEQNRELSMQLTLLRQAFDSLKSQMMGQSDLKPKAQSSGVSGVGASAEPRAAQNDGAPKVARYLNRAASQRMMERIESALKEAARSKDGKTITLRLEPLQLGQVKCDVSLRDGLLHARITPQNPEVAGLVREHSHELQGALRRLGLNVDRVTVQVLSEKDPAPVFNAPGSLDGKSFQENGNNMPGKREQTPEKTFGNNFADVTAASTSDAGIAPADHWIA